MERMKERRKKGGRKRRRKTNNLHKNTEPHNVFRRGTGICARSPITQEHILGSGMCFEQMLILAKKTYFLGWGGVWGGSQFLEDISVKPDISRPALCKSSCPGNC